MTIGVLGVEKEDGFFHVESIAFPSYPSSMDSNSTRNQFFNQKSALELHLYQG
jgi:hypothetical protein